MSTIQFLRACRTPSALAVWLAAGVAFAAPQGEPPQEVLALEPVVVVATKAPRPLRDVAGTVSVIDAQDLSDQLAQGAADLFRYQPGVAWEGSGGNRFAGHGFNIRGIGGNRVAIEIDGVPAPDGFSIGSFSDAGRDPVDVAILDRVEVLRGPASTLYGSDALGGVVAFFTRDPERMVSAQDRTAWSLRAEHNGADHGVASNLTAARVAETWGGLASITYRRGEELDRATGTAGDERDYETTSLFAKVTRQTGDHDLELAIDQHQREDHSTLASVLGNGRFARTTALQGADDSERRRISVTDTFEGRGRWLDQGRLTLYQQSATARQFTNEERAGLGYRRERLFEFEQDVAGIEFHATRDMAGAGLHHRLAFGIDLARTQTREARDARQIDLVTGASTSVVLGERFPVRDFPISRADTIGVYLSDEITRPGSRLVVLPALRFDYFDLSPRLDPVFLEDFPDAPVTALSEQDVSPKLGLLYRAGDSLDLFAHYAHGFRAPPFEDVNIAFDIPLFGYRAIPNPELRSETSDGIEVGLRHASGGTRLTAALFYSEYDDFIESRVPVGVDPTTGVLLFQSRNRDESRIYGAELQWTQRLDGLVEGLALDLGLSWTDGEDRRTGQTLDSLQPAEAMLSLNWDDPRRPLSLRATLTGVAARDDLDTAAVGDPFAPDGYATVDLIGAYQLHPAASLRVGLFNAFDRSYWRWSEVRGLATDDPLVPALSGPGRYLSTSLTIRW